MRDWQVGDPIGDGNDIGVPDVAYMGYLKDDESGGDIFDDFKFYLNHALDFYNDKDYERAFSSIYSAYRVYGKLEEFEKSQLRPDPFNRDWIIELCCLMVNEHGKYYSQASEIVIKNRLHVKLCMDCDCFYPVRDNYCIRCGNPLLDPYERSPDKVCELIRKGLLGWVFDEVEIQDVTDRSLRLMKSNGSRLVKINRGISGDFDFIFEKENKYIKTTYTCEYLKYRIPGRIFEDFSTTHNHDRLLEDKSFQKLVMDVEDKTGFRFKECLGGYGYDLDEDHYNFIFTDEIKISVDFEMPDGRIASYGLDLDNMSLSRDYVVY